MSATEPTSVSDLSISEVLDVIAHDPEYAESTAAAVPASTAEEVREEVKEAKPAASPSVARSSRMNSSASLADPDIEIKRRAYVKILEQPASKALRFRYECEGRSAGSIPGAKSTADSKTFPAIQVVGYRGRAVVVVSCVTKDLPYRPHPHSLVGKEGCKKGVCTLEINNENMMCTFSNLGIQCVKKKGVDEALKQREEIRVDPFHTGFGHRNQPQGIDLNAVRLCFQVFLEGSQKGKFTFQLKAVVSDPIYDKKAMCDLTICKLSDCSAPVSGGREIIMLCDKVTKDDIQVRFYQEVDGHLGWEGFGEFSASDVHKQVAISFRTPRYNKTTDGEGAIDVWIQLRRPSDGAMSEPRPFQFIPKDTDVDWLERKKRRIAETNSSRLDAYILDNSLKSNSRAARPNNGAGNAEGVPVAVAVAASSRPIRQVTRTKIKREPADLPNADCDQQAVYSGMPARFVSPFPNPPVNFANNASSSSSSSNYQTTSMSPNHGISFAPNISSSSGLSASNINQSPGFAASASPNPAFARNMYNPSSELPVDYNIPVPTPSGRVVGINQPAANHVPVIDGHIDFQGFPFNEVNESLIEAHMLDLCSEMTSNLSIQDVGADEENREDNRQVQEPAVTFNIPPNPSANEGARPRGPMPQQQSSAMNVSVSDFPELTLSGMLTSGDLDNVAGLDAQSSSALIRDLDDLNNLSKSHHQPP